MRGGFLHLILSRIQKVGRLCSVRTYMGWCFFGVDKFRYLVLGRAGIVTIRFFPLSPQQPNFYSHLSGSPGARSGEVGRRHTLFFYSMADLSLLQTFPFSALPIPAPAFRRRAARKDRYLFFPLLPPAEGGRGG